MKMMKFLPITGAICVGIAMGALSPLLADAGAPVTVGARPVIRAATPGPFEGNGGRAAMFGTVTNYISSQAKIGNIGQSLIFDNDQAPPVPDNYGVGLFLLGHARGGAGDSWAGNIASYVDREVSHSTNQFALELDQNIQNREYGAVPWKFSAADQEFIAAPLAITGTAGPSTFRSTAAMIVQSAGGQGFNRGIALSGDAIRVASIQDSTNSENVMLVGGLHRVGIDFSHAKLSKAAIIVPNNIPVEFVVPGGRTVRVYTDATGTLHLGDRNTPVTIGGPLALASTGPAYADARAARSGGLKSGAIYRSPGGTLKIVE